MNILAVSDIEDKYIWDHFDSERFKDIDIIISCGDLKASYLEFLVTMIPAPLLYVHGNHDTRYSKNPPEGCMNIDGRVYIHKNGVRIAGLGGSMRYRPDTSHQYSENEMKKRADKIKRTIKKSNGIDILVTHSPAFGIGDGQDAAHTGFEVFLTMMDDYSPKYMLHGHQHSCYNRRLPRKHIYKSTQIINVGPYYIFEYVI
jgi:Icc-related predicted phosphoesterase